MSQPIVQSSYYQELSKSKSELSDDRLKIPNDMYKCICAESIRYKDNSLYSKSDEVNIGLPDTVTALAMYKECPLGTKFEILSDKDSEKQQSAIVNRLRQYAKNMEVGDFFVCLFSGKAGELCIEKNGKKIDISHITPCFFVKNSDGSISHSFSDPSGAFLNEIDNTIKNSDLIGTEVTNNKKSRILFVRCITAVETNKDLSSIVDNNQKTRIKNLEETSLYYNNFGIQGQRCGNCAVLSFCSSKSFCENFASYIRECKKTNYENKTLNGFRSSYYYSTFIRDSISKSDEIFCYAVLNNCPINSKDSIKNKIAGKKGIGNFNDLNIIVSSEKDFNESSIKNDFLPIYDHDIFLFAIRKTELNDSSGLSGFNSLGAIINICPGALSGQDITKIERVDQAAYDRNDQAFHDEIGKIGGPKIRKNYIVTGGHFIYEKSEKEKQINNGIQLHINSWRSAPGIKICRTGSIPSVRTESINNKRKSSRCNLI